MLTFEKNKRKKEDKPMLFNDRSLLYSAEKALELIEKNTKKIGKKFNETHKISTFFLMPYQIDIRYIYALYMENKVDHNAIIAMYPSPRGYRLYMVSFDSYKLTGNILLRPFQMIYRRSKMLVEYVMGPEDRGGLRLE